MPLFARIAFAAVDFAARKGLAAISPTGDSDPESEKHRARRTGVRGETYAYWYLRRHGYIVLARNYMSPGMKGEIDLVGYDGRLLAFVEVERRGRLRHRRKRDRARRRFLLSKPSIGKRGEI